MQRLAPDFVLQDRYRLIRLIATGGMGVVWEGRDELLDRIVAIKIMHPHTATEHVFAERFRDEAQYAAKLNSPHIVHVHDYGSHDELAFLVMELVPGRTVAQLIADQGPLGPDFVRSVMAQVASGLMVAHEWGIVHRDVKPGNILVTPAGEAKLSDFGIARAAERANYTKAGEVLGTPQYLSPEQAQGAIATPQSDLYALGIVVHEMLTGNKPFDRPTPVAIALAHVTDPPPPLPGKVPPDLRAMVEACLAKDPGDRPASARIVASALGLPTAVLPEGASPDHDPVARRAVGAPTPRGGVAVARAARPIEDADADGRPLAPARAPVAGSGVRQTALAALFTLVVVLLCLAAVFL